MGTFIESLKYETFSKIFCAGNSDKMKIFDGFLKKYMESLDSYFKDRP